jgi:uncharacterized membrane protein YdjX (TVP38/TMEM64 family)
LSLCLIEISSNFKEYTKASIISNVPIAIFYSSFGSVLLSLSLVTSAAIIVALSVLFYLLRRKEWVIKWSEFFEEEREDQQKQRMPA